MLTQILIHHYDILTYSSLNIEPLKSLLTSMQEVGYDSKTIEETKGSIPYNPCLLYTSDAADERPRV